MVPRPPLSKGEMEVVRAVWRLGEATVGQVFDYLSERTEHDYTTVQTYIRRLESKGYLRSRRVGRNKIYSPKVRPQTVIGEAVNDFMNQVFDGEVLPLMRHLIQRRGVSDEEVAQLRRLLEEFDDEEDEERSDD